MVLLQPQEIHREPTEPQKLAVVDFDFFVDKIVYYKGEHTKACTVLTQALEVEPDKTE